MILGQYRSLLSEPGFGRLVVGCNIARLPISIVPLAAILLVRHRTGSYVDAGAVTAAWALAAGALAPLQGRLVDRYGQPRVLLPSGALCSVALGGFVAAALASAPVAVLAILAGLAGAAFPPVGASMRGLWKERLGEDQRLATAYSFESVAAELTFVAGPALCALVVSLASPQAAIGGSAVAVLVGTVVMALAPESRRWPAGTRRVGFAGALAERGLRTLVFLTIPIGAALGTLDLGMPAFARWKGHPAAAGLLLTAFALGSMAGGLWFGTRRWPEETLLRRFLVVGVIFALGLAPLVAAPSLGVMGALSVVSGLALAPAVTCMYLLVDRVAPPGTGTEAYTWILTATEAGQAVGAALAGVISQHAGVRPALLLATGAAVVAVLIAVLRRGTLARLPAPTTTVPASA